MCQACGCSSIIIVHPHTKSDIKTTVSILLLVKQKLREACPASKRQTRGQTDLADITPVFGEGVLGKGIGTSLAAIPWPALTHLLEDLGSHGVAAVEDDAEFPASLHLLEQRARVVRVQGQLADLQADVVS